MITNDDISRSVNVLRDLGASRVLLFGSAQDNPSAANDLDLACNGLKPEKYYYAVGVLLALLGKPVDLIDLDRGDRIALHVEKHGRVIYEC